MSTQHDSNQTGIVSRLIRLCLEQKLIVALSLLIMLTWGIIVSPFNWNTLDLPSNPIPVDAIPDIGENQQIVFTEWNGRSPQDIDDQITYPMTVALLGIPGVKDIRSFSAFGFSTIFIVFEDDIEFYWSRTRILEKLGSLPSGTLPQGVNPILGPDATALGQVFWYTLEGQDPLGNPTGGWGPDELRSIQDFTVKYQLAGVPGVSEVASIGGFVREYQVDVNPDAMRAAGVTLTQVINAVRKSNLDVGARTLEVNRVEYIVRGIGFIKSPRDLEITAITEVDDQPILIGDIAKVSFGPALRRGALTKAGVEAVGGVVIARYGENPMETIEAIKEKIKLITPGLPSKILNDGTQSQVTIVPFYDRSGLIKETVQTLHSAIEQQVYMTIIVVVLMVMHLRSSMLIGLMLPITVLGTFICMKMFHVDANIVALSGIAIAIGTIVDMGIVLCENILRHLDEASPDESRLEVVHRASAEVGGAVLTAVATTIIGFLPVFTMQAAEGKLFGPLAYTKTFALIVSIIVALTILPAAAQLLMGFRIPTKSIRIAASSFIVITGIVIAFFLTPLPGVLIAVFGVFHIVEPSLPRLLSKSARWSINFIVVAFVLLVLAKSWEPLGPESGHITNTIFIAATVAILLILFWIVRLLFPHILTWALRHKAIALSPALLVILFGSTVWLGFDQLWSWLPDRVRQTTPVVSIAHSLPGLGSEFMPSLDEGSFLYMPTAMPHISIGESIDILKELDLRIMSVPEVKLAVGKIGRVDSPLDPAPISMIETIIEYKSEYITDDQGKRLLFEKNDAGELIESEHGEPVRQWRDHIQSSQDIWDEIIIAARMPGVTSAPKLQPIETRIIMLQSGFRAPMGIKVYGPDLETIESFGLQLESLLKQVPSINSAAVFADRVVGKPYLEIEINREKIARYGIHISDVQEVIEVAIGGKVLTSTVEGRERYPVRVRYLRELRDRPETLTNVLVPAPDGTQVPLAQLATLNYRRGPQVIKSENTFLVSYVLFDKKPEVAEVTAVNDAKSFINSKIDSGELIVPAGLSFDFSGSYKNQLRASRRLKLVLPLSLIIIFMLLYLQLKSAATTFMVFSGVFVAWGGGFIMLWLYAQPWFLDINLLGTNLRDLFQIRPYNLSVAVWVGFLALFGIATDDGLIMAIRIKQSFAEDKPQSIEAIRKSVITGGRLRIRAAVMTSATTILALLPVLTSTGKGADIMIPMAIPTFGGMTVASITWFVVPILYSWTQEIKHRYQTRFKAPLLKDTNHE